MLKVSGTGRGISGLSTLGGKIYCLLELQFITRDYMRFSLESRIGVCEENLQIGVRRLVAF